MKCTLQQRCEAHTNVWKAVVNSAIRSNVQSSPRGQGIHEILGAQVALDISKPPVVLCPVRKVHYPFLFGEAWWILSGRDDVASIEPFNRHIKRFSGDGDVFFGAYGPKIHNQYSEMLEKLVSDNDSRQAVINIWRENPPDT